MALNNQNLSSIILQDFLDENYSKNTFGVRYSILHKGNTELNKKRYYAKPIYKDYYLTNDWYEKNRDKLESQIEIFKKDKKLSDKTDAEYYDMLNPNTGLRYDIPLLTQSNPEYFWKYIHFMKMKENSPETFNKMMNWD